ncbi:MAG: methyltransferase domain-containing protein [Methanospirillum sp.]|uniref:methyltransferase domain-containing protein n=1 Tax=Methanospirillum sp. TaxID=45200 RepID=UPI002374A311|nr:methyltransferase domain-containing protein [Methanospirillum sp.]MDD1729103.1 methyltransferase domain-containing protein [Methanospirillum sp.]
MKLIFELWGEHPDIPRAEISCLGTVTDHRVQVAIADIADPVTVQRLAYTHRVMEYQGECSADEKSFINMLNCLNITTDQPFCGRVKKMDGSQMSLSTTQMERLIGTYIEGPVSVSEPKTIFRAIASGDRIYFGTVLWELDRGPYHDRKPGNREFFHPGVMMPRMIRSLVNLAHAMPDEIVLDPFCGTGGTQIESELIGCTAIGTDADPFMIQGTRRNLPGSQAAIADVRHLPFPDGSIDLIVSDLPYGQSVFIIGSGLDDLYQHALAEMLRVTKPRFRSVIVTHRDIRPLVARFFTICEYYEQRVHRSLTRRILVIMHDNGQSPIKG